MPAQENLLRYQIQTDATRALRLHRIPISKTYGDISAELGRGFGKMMLQLIISKPEMRHEYATVGFTVIVEFASLVDAIEAFRLVDSGGLGGYEDTGPVYVPELSTRPVPAKEYCGCMNCEDSRAAVVLEKAASIEKMKSDYDRASSHRSGLGTGSSSLGRGNPLRGNGSRHSAAGSYDQKN